MLKVANFSSKLQWESVFIISVLNANFVWIPLLWFFPMIETLECNKKIVRLQKAHAHDVYFNMFSLKASKQASVILYKKWSCSRRAEVCQPWQPGQSQPLFGTLSARSNPTQERWYHRISQSKLTQAIIRTIWWTFLLTYLGSTGQWNPSPRKISWAFDQKTKLLLASCLRWTMAFKPIWNVIIRIQNG